MIRFLRELSDELVVLQVEGIQGEIYAIFFENASQSTESSWGDTMLGGCVCCTEKL